MALFIEIVQFRYVEVLDSQFSSQFRFIKQLIPHNFLPLPYFRYHSPILTIPCLSQLQIIYRASLVFIC
jgi:hypothetical protein